MEHHLRSSYIHRAVAMALLLAGQSALADDASPPVPGGETSEPPKFYAFCVGLPEVKQPSIPQQAGMLRELGFDGVGYPLWLDDQLDKNLQALDEAGLDVYLLYTSVNLKPDAPAVDPRVTRAIRKLKGRPATVCVLVRGFPPGDPQGEQPAVKVLRQLGDAAAEAGVRISIYHHTNDWTESLLHALRIVEKTDHPQVGANFNLCHWLMVDGDQDYEPILREHADKIFAVTINGAQRGTKKWTGGLIQPLDCGDFDNQRLLDVLRQSGYAGPVGLMCYGIPGDAGTHLKRSLDVWRSWYGDGSDPESN
jgi:sugar phosphate isomerase/epimerase